MANGGGSRIGGFFRGVLVGLVVCAIAAVALSLSAPVPERVEPALAPEVLGGADGEAGTSALTEPEAVAPATDTAMEPSPAAPQEGTATEAEVIVLPAEEDAADATAGDDGAPAPQATWETAPAEGEEPERGEAFQAPQSPTE